MAWRCEHCGYEEPYRNPEMMLACPYCGTVRMSAEASAPQRLSPQRPVIEEAASKEAVVTEEEEEEGVPEEEVTTEEEEVPTPYVALLLCILCVAIFLYQHFAGPLMDVDTEWIEETFAFVWRDGSPDAWWQWVTGAFLHADAAHLIGNMVGCSYLATEVERRIGHFSLLGLCLFGAIAGNFGELIRQSWMEGAVPEQMMVVGFSGVVCAFGGVVFFRAPFWTLVFIVPSLVPGLMERGETSSQIAYGGHIGGFALGLFFGLVSLSAKKRTFLVILALLAALLFMLAVLLFLVAATGGFS